MSTVTSAQMGEDVELEPFQIEVMTAPTMVSELLICKFYHDDINSN